MGQLKTYSSDLTDAEWARIAPLLPADKLVGRLREVDLRDVLDAIFDRVENGVTCLLIFPLGKLSMVTFGCGCAWDYGNRSMRR
jgi:hypothetical protein